MLKSLFFALCFLQKVLKSHALQVLGGGTQGDKGPAGDKGPVGEYVLLSFWASWDRQSVEEQDSLASVIQELRKEKFTAVSVSLDMNRKTWTDAIGQKDTIQWKQEIGRAHV